MPVQDIAANPETFPRIMIAVITTVCIMYISFGYFTTAAWGADQKTPLITEKLQHETFAPDWIGNIVKILFCFNLVFSFPLVLYPSIMIFENYLFDGWEKTPKRQWLKNLNRAIIVGICVGFTILLGDKLDKFLSILGALCCTPIAFIFPAAFHLKACAESTPQKVIDISILVLGLAIMGYCTTTGLLNWNSRE